MTVGPELTSGLAAAYNDALDEIDRAERRCHNLELQLSEAEIRERHAEQRIHDLEAALDRALNPETARW